jgi:hypothetical protein
MELLGEPGLIFRIDRISGGGGVGIFTFSPSRFGLKASGERNIDRRKKLAASSSAVVRIKQGGE